MVANAVGIQFPVSGSDFRFRQIGDQIKRENKRKESTIFLGSPHFQ